MKRLLCFCFHLWVVCPHTERVWCKQCMELR